MTVKQLRKRSTKVPRKLAKKTDDDEREIVVTPDSPFYAFVAYQMGRMTEDEARRFLATFK